MAQASLLHRPMDTGGRHAFAFEHMMAHRNLFGVMAPVDRFSVLPYLLDPEFDHGKWHLNHGTAHDDFGVTLPSFFGLTEVGLPTSQPLVDTNLDNNEQRTWWTWANHQEHFMASLNSEGLPQTFPFW